MADRGCALERSVEAEEDYAKVGPAKNSRWGKPLLGCTNRNNDCTSSTRFRQQFAVRTGIDAYHICCPKRRDVETSEGRKQPPRGDTTVDHGVLGEDQMVEDEDRLGPEAPSEMDVEVAHVSDDDSVHSRELARLPP